MTRDDFLISPKVGNRVARAQNPYFIYNFSTKAAGDFTDPATIERAARTFGAGKLLALRQVHGDRIIDTGQGALLEGPETGVEADGWAGKLAPGVLYGVRTADCLPVALWDERGQYGAMLHAGWRSAVSHICRLSVDKLGTMGISPQNLYASLGPCIAGGCYEVGADVADAAGRDARWLVDKPGGKFLFDVRAFVFHELTGAGLKPENIEVSALCTHCEEELFFSHRARAEKGRMISFMGLNR